MAKDRLSNLPDDLICHILSFLPTKDAYITSVLSTRWISLCTKVPDLHFKIPSSRNWSRKRSYSECVDSNSIHSICAGVRRRTEKIRKLTLHSNDCEPYAIAIQKWVTKALDLGVKELDLHLHFVLYRTIFFPRKLSTLESLVVLKLQGQIQPSLTSISYLPSLKILNLEVTYWRNTENVSGNCLSTFLSGCPRLEELQIRGLLRFPLEISLHFLKRLCLHLGFSPTMCYLPALILNVPSIETLDMHDHSHHIYEVVNLFNVDRATLNISKPLTINARLYLYQLMEGLSNVKSLYLDLCTTVQFLKTKNSIYYLSHLQFHNLLCLRVQIPLDCNWDVLVAFLQNSPNLEVLIIEKYFERNSKRSEVTNSSWTKPTIIPTCLLTSFKVLEFRGNPYYKIELDFKKYIIENSAKLEKVILSTKERLYYEWKEELKDFDQEELYLSSCRCSS